MRALPAAGFPVLLALLGLLIPGAPVVAQQDPAGESPSVQPDTLPVDSTRVRVLGVLERLSRPPVSRQLILDGDSAFLAGVETSREIRGGSRTGAPAAVSAPPRADSIMLLLLGLEGYSPARYEAEFAEFETADGRLTLLSPAGLAQLRAATFAEDSAAAAPSVPDADAPPEEPLAEEPPESPEAGGEPAVEEGGEPVVEGSGTPESGVPDAIPPVRLYLEGREIQADTAIRYFERTGRIRTVGNTRSIDSNGSPLESRSLVYSLEEGRGTAMGATTRYSEGAGEWIVRGDANSITPGEAWLHSAMFTSCELEEPHSHFRVNEIKVVNGRVLVARPVVLYFADVPVAWLPFIAQGLGSGRTSGILTPRFSVNDIVRTSGGYARRVSNMGLYWAMNDYSDASLAFDWFSSNFTALTGTARYNWSERFLRGDLAYRQYWREAGGQEIAFDSRHDWQVNERTNVRVSARYASSASFVRQNSFDPREATQSINSNGGLSRRFGWGTLSATANRNQYLTDDRVETTLPSLNLSLSPLTLFRAPPGRARFYNNLTWTGSAGYKRDVFERPAQPGDRFDPSRWNRVATGANASSSFSLGNLSWSQSARFNELLLQGVPIPPAAVEGAEGEGEEPQLPTAFADRTRADVEWNSSLSYSQRLIGATTLTPSVSLSGALLRADSLAVASSAFLSAPRRVSFGAGLNTELYGFFPGVGGFDAIRHKISPGVDYQYSPAVTPTLAQIDAFGAREALAQNVVTLRLNQTFEARRRPREGGAADSVAGGPEADSASARAPAGSAQGAPRRLERPEVVRLLGLQTSSLTYDFVLADSVGGLRAIRPTQLSNTITSDYLRGLSLQTEHDLFDDRAVLDGGARKIAPFLTSVALGFSLGSSSSLVRFLTGAGSSQVAREPTVSQDGLGDESAIIPGMGSRPGRQNAGRFTGDAGAWNANVSYALRRTREQGADGGNQMVQGNVTFRPTANWDLRWSTSYDVVGSGFNDHIVSLTRSLHEWDATFDFVQTATGNWTFRFNVALVANRDLKFDYEQRSRSVDRDAFFR